MGNICSGEREVDNEKPAAQALLSKEDSFPVNDQKPPAEVKSEDVPPPKEETKVESDPSVCPLIPGYDGLAVPNAGDIKEESQQEAPKSDATQEVPNSDAKEKATEDKTEKVEECKDESTEVGRSLHWVIRNSALEASLQFFEQVLGMCVLRHEENDKPCDMTCNGRFNTSWSKTMMGYKGREEDFAYALEVTYNYGISNYEKGNGLQNIGIYVPDPETSFKAAKELGFNVNDNVVAGPDGYNYQLLSMLQERQEPFAYVALQVNDLKRSVEFYTNVIGMHLLADNDVSFEVPENASILGFESSEKSEGVPLVLTQAEDVQVVEYDGRHAIEMPEKKIRAIYEEIEKTNADLIVHKLRELDDQVGTLVITIIKDHDGYEICLVSSETFPLLAKKATDYKTPDFLDRESRQADA